MRFRCWFASGVARMGCDARIAANTACGSSGLPGLSDLTRAGLGMPRVAEWWEST